MDDFTQRHLGASTPDQTTMLAALGYTSLDELTDAAVPAAIRLTEPLRLPSARSEFEVQRQLAALAGRNVPGTAMIGLGYHGTITPPVIRRTVLENPAWYTAYTPYQPEISQGRLEALANFQTMVSDLTGLPVAGASLLDEGTAVAEAVAVAHRVSRKGGVVVVDANLLPQSLAVLRTRSLATGVEVVVATGDLADTVRANQAFAVVVQVPGADGVLPSAAGLRELAELAHSNGALLIAACDFLALTLIGSAGEWGADIAVGSTQRFGVPLFYGGPHAGFIAVRAGLERQLPGRVVGLSKDADGVPAFRLALQTREQHIRREKATSNICTAQVLLAVAASCYAVHHGPQGLADIAGAVHLRARRLAAALLAAGFELAGESFFDTITVTAPGRAAEVVAAARAAEVHGAGDVREALRPVVDGITARCNGQQHLRRTDVRRRLLASDVLLARLQGEAEGRHPVGVLGQPHDASGQLTLEACADGDVTGVRTTVEQRDAEALRRADGDVRAPLRCRPDHGERERVARCDQQGTVGVRQLGELAQAGCRRQDAVRPRHLHHDGERLVGADGVGELAGGDDNLDATGEGPGVQHPEALRQEVGVDDNDAALAGDAVRDGDGLGDGRTLVEQARAGDRQAGEVGHHGLEVGQRLEPALADLGLVGRVGGVPGGVLQHGAPDHRRGDGAVVAEPDHGRAGHVACGEGSELALHLELAARGRQLQRFGQPDRRGNGGIGQLVEAGVPQRFEHRGLVGRRGAQMALGEIVHGRHKPIPACHQLRP